MRYFALAILDTVPPTLAVVNANTLRVVSIALNPWEKRCLESIGVTETPADARFFGICTCPIPNTVSMTNPTSMHGMNLRVNDATLRDLLELGIAECHGRQGRQMGHGQYAYSQGLLVMAVSALSYGILKTERSRACPNTLNRKNPVVSSG